MSDAHNSNRRNDNRLLTPLLVMALIIVGGFMYFAFAGHAPPTAGSISAGRRSGQ